MASSERQRHTERLAPGCDLRLEFRDMFGAPGLGDPEPPRHPRQAEAKSDQGDEDDAESCKTGSGRDMESRRRSESAKRDGECRSQRKPRRAPGERRG